MNDSSRKNGAFIGVLLVALLTITTGTVSAAESRERAVEGATVERAQAVQKKPGRTKLVTAPPNAPRYKCEDGECVCKGVLDCKSLIDSGFCKGKDFWQGEDPSEGGCG